MAFVNATPAKAAAGWCREWPVVLLAGAWIFLWCHGHPRPHVDDLFFSGTAVELVRSGRLENPWLGAWMETFGTRLYLVHPPFFPYFLAGWIQVFGHTTAALTGFHCFISGTATLALYATLRRAGVGAIGATVAGVLLTVLLLSMGMRPDSVALLLVILSQVCLARPGVPRWIAGSALAAAAVLTQSFSLALVLPLFSWQVLLQMRTGVSLGSLATATFAGLTVTFLLFCWALPSSIAEFLRVYLTHARLVTTPLQESVAMVWSTISFGKEPLRLGPAWLIIVAALVNALRPNSTASHVRTAWIVLGLVGILGGVLYATYAVRYVLFGGLLLAAVTFATAGLRTATVGATCVLLVTAWANAGALISWTQRPATPALAEIRAAIAAHPERRLLVDAVSARVVYDFDLPPGATDWSSRLPAGRGYSSSIRDKPANELWVVSAWRLEQHVPDAGIQAARLRFAGRTFGSIDGDPNRIHVLP